MARQLRNVYFEVTGACNLLCTHCYVFDDERRRARPDLLTPGIVESVVRDAAPLGLEMCTFTGGEILIRKDIVEILERAAIHVPRLYLLTNLTLLTAAHVEAFARLPIELVSTSIDGFETTHDRFRGKVGSYERTMHALERLRDADIPVKVSVTVTEQNLSEAEELFARLDELGIPSSIARVTPVGRGKNVAADDRDFDRAYSLQLARRLGTSLTRRQVLGLEAPGEELSTHCGVGANILYVMSDGEVGYCPTMTPATDGRWRLGNVRETSIAEIWRGGSVFGEEDMQCANVAKCTYGSVCRGGCRSNAFTATGDATACDTEMRQGFDALAALANETSALPVYRVV